MAIQLTDAAAQRIQRFLDKDTQALGFRVGVKKMGCSGWGYEVGIATEIHPDDVEFIDKGVRILVSAAALDKVDGTQIDFVAQGINRVFTYNNPNAKGECGCGESFTTEVVEA